MRCLPISYRVRSSSFIPNVYLSYSTPVRSPIVWSFSCLFRQTRQSLFPLLLSHSSLMILSFCCRFTELFRFFCVCFLFSQHSAFAFLFVFPFCLMLFPWCIFLSSFDLSIFCNELLFTVFSFKQIEILECSHIIIIILLLYSKWIYYCCCNLLLLLLFVLIFNATIIYFRMFI